jgi:hypothetical protein
LPVRARRCHALGDCRVVVRAQAAERVVVERVLAERAHVSALVRPLADTNSHKVSVVPYYLLYLVTIKN